MLLENGEIIELHPKWLKCFVTHLENIQRLLDTINGKKSLFIWALPSFFDYLAFEEFHIINWRHDQGENEWNLNLKIVVLTLHIYMYICKGRYV